MSKYFKSQSYNNDILTTSGIKNSWKIDRKNERYKYIIKTDFLYKTETVSLYYTDLNLRNKDFKELTKILTTSKQPTKGVKNTMLDSVKNFYKEHENVLFPLFVLVALDYFFNDGRFQKKIAKAIEGIVDRVVDKVSTKQLEENNNE